MTSRREQATRTQAREPHAFSRRTFLKGVAGTAALAGAIGAAGGLSGCGSKVDTTGLMVSSSDLVTTDDFTEVSSDDFVDNDLNVTLPLGTMVWSVNDSYALLMLTGSGAHPLNTLAVLNAKSGSQQSILDKAVGNDEGYEIYEARASENLVVWTEVKYSSYDWRVFAARFNASGTLSNAQQLDQGGSDYMPPLLCACGTQAVWTLVPDSDGSSKSEGSVCKAWGLGDSSPHEIYRCDGYMYAIPERSDGIVTITPRIDADTVNYALTAQYPDSGDIIAQTTLPVSVRPLDAIYMNDRFAFQIEASFDSSSAIAQVGTYYDLGDGRWFRINRTPACTPAVCGDWFISKGNKGTVVANLNSGTYFTINAPDLSADYGDYLATSGSCSRFIVYSTVTDASDASSATVQLRGFSFK